MLKRKLSTLLVCLALLSVPAAVIGKKGEGEKSTNSADAVVSTGRSEFGTPVEVTVAGVAEPSGVTWHRALGRLLVIGDEGSLTAVTRAGKKDWTVYGLGDLEDVAVDEGSGLILLLSEQSSKILVFDPQTRKTVGTWKLDRAGLLGREPSENNSGFEGLAVNPGPSKDGKLTLYLTHQAKPAMLVAVRVPLVRGSQTISAQHVQDSFSWKGYSDLTAVTCVPGSSQILVLSEKYDSLLLVDPAGRLNRVFTVGGRQQEGVCFDDEGTLWIADDRAALLRYDGALRKLRPGR